MGAPVDNIQILRYQTKQNKARMTAMLQCGHASRQVHKQYAADIHNGVEKKSPVLSGCTYKGNVTCLEIYMYIYVYIYRYIYIFFFLGGGGGGGGRPFNGS